MILLRNIPLFAYFLIAINGLMIGQKSYPELAMASPVFAFTLTSGAQLTFNVAHILILSGVFALYIEIFKATRSGTESIVDHLLSMLVFVAFLVEFLIYQPAGSMIFLTLTFMSLLDVVAGFTVTISTARRDIGRS